MWYIFVPIKDGSAGKCKLQILYRSHLATEVRNDRAVYNTAKTLLFLPYFLCESVGGISGPVPIIGRRNSCQAAEKAAHIGRIIEMQLCGYVFNRQIGIGKISLYLDNDLLVDNLFRRCFHRLLSQFAEIVGSDE